MKLFRVFFYPSASSSNSPSVSSSIAEYSALKTTKEDKKGMRRKKATMIMAVGMLLFVLSASIAVAQTLIQKDCEDNPAKECQGTKQDELIIGSNERDIIYARGGNDTVFDRGGDDKVSGGGGDDTLNGGSGFDKLFGGDGDDTIDVLDNPSSEDFVACGPGEDDTVFKDGNDTVVNCENVNPMA